jgi:hypothetical protein
MLHHAGRHREGEEAGLAFACLQVTEEVMVLALGANAPVWRTSFSRHAT